MPLIVVILVLLAVGILLMLINKYGTGHIDAKILQIINVVVIIAVIIWLLKVFGVWEYISRITV